MLPAATGSLSQIPSAASESGDGPALLSDISFSRWLDTLQLEARRAPRGSWLLAKPHLGVAGAPCPTGTPGRASTGSTLPTACRQAWSIFSIYVHRTTCSRHTVGFKCRGHLRVRPAPTPQVPPSSPEQCVSWLEPQFQPDRRPLFSELLENLPLIRPGANVQWALHPPPLPGGLFSVSAFHHLCPRGRGEREEGSGVSPAGGREPVGRGGQLPCTGQWVGQGARGSLPSQGSCASLTFGVGSLSLGAGYTGVRGYSSLFVCLKCAIRKFHEVKNNPHMPEFWIEFFFLIRAHI